MIRHPHIPMTWCVREWNGRLYKDSEVNSHVRFFSFSRDDVTDEI